MATIGLKVQDSPIGGDLSLANMLSKSIFGDPEGQMKARVMASQVGAHEAYREKQLADAGLVGVKTSQEQDILDAERRAGPAVGEAAALAVPQPVPVEVSRASVPENTRYGPQIVDQSKLNTDTARYDALVAQERALGRLLVHGNPNEVATGVNKNYGGAILAGATANPAIVNPDSLRLASTLYTGSAPTTNTVMTSGDYAGVDAEARGKILEARAKPSETKTVTVNDQVYAIEPGPDGKPGLRLLPGNPEVTPAAPELKKDAAGNDIQWDPTTRTWVPAPGAKPAPEKPVEVGPNAMLPPDPSDPTHTYRTPKTDRPTIVAGPYDEVKSVEGRNNKTIRDIMTLASQPIDPLRPPAITPQMARDYDQAFTENFGAKTTVQKVPDPKTGEPIDAPVTIYPDRPGFLSPTEMYKRAGVEPPAPAPIIPVPTPTAPAASAAPVQAPAPGGVVVGAPLGPTPKKPITTEQEKSRTYTVLGDESSKYLDKLNQNNMPWGPSISGARYAATPGLGGSLASSVTPDSAKEYMGNAKAFIEAYARPATGAQISETDYENFFAAMIPLPGDPPSEFKRKSRLRSALVNVWKSGSGFQSDAERDAWFAQNAGLTSGGAGPSSAPVETPPASYPGTAAGWAKMPPEKRALFK